MAYNKTRFFEKYREEIDHLDPDQVRGLEFLLDRLSTDSFNLRQSAYFLATIAHETGWTFQPVKEKGGRAYLSKYWTNPKLRKNLGNTRPEDAYDFAGKGYVQITGRANYEKFGLDDEPEKALEPEIAYAVASRGMREGLFTGKRLSDYVSDSMPVKPDYKNARRVINGTDRAADIANLARKFEAILSSSGEAAQPNAMESGKQKPVQTEASVKINEQGKVLPQETIVVPPAIPVDSSSKKSMWVMILSIPGLVLTWVVANIERIMGWATGVDVNAVLKLVVIVGGALAVLFLMRQIVMGAIRLIASVLYTLRSMQYHADPKANNVVVGQPAPPKEVA